MPALRNAGMRPISLDLRQRVVAMRHEDGQSMGEIAKRFRNPKGTVQNILERNRDNGKKELRPQNAGRKRGLSKEHLNALEQLVVHHPNTTLERLREGLSLPVTIITIHNSLKRMGFTLKKNRYVRVNKSDPMQPDNENNGSGRCPVWIRYVWCS